MNVRECFISVFCTTPLIQQFLPFLVLKRPTISGASFVSKMLNRSKEGVFWNELPQKYFCEHKFFVILSHIAPLTEKKPSDFMKTKSSWYSLCIYQKNFKKKYRNFILYPFANTRAVAKIVRARETRIAPFKKLDYKLRNLNTEVSLETQLPKFYRQLRIFRTFEQPLFQRSRLVIVYFYNSYKSNTKIECW